MGSTVVNQESLITTLTAPAKAIMAESGATTAIKNAVGGFAETLPVLMKALDDIGKIHPVIQGSILAHETSGGCADCAVSCRTCL